MPVGCYSYTSSYTCNLEQNICGFTFYVLTQFLFTTSQMELYYYHKKVNVRVSSRVADPGS